MDTIDTISPRMIIRDVIARVGDQSFNHGLSEGWYMTQVRKMLDKMAYKTSFDQQTIDIAIDKVSLQIEVPKGVWNIKEMYVWNGVNFVLGASQQLWWKRQFNNTPGGANYTALQKDNDFTFSGDPIVDDYTFILNGFTGFVNLLWFNVENGLLMLSPGCAGWTYVRMKYGGTYGDISEVKFVPRIFWEYAEDFIAYRYHRYMSVYDRATHFPLMKEADQNMNLLQTGSWWDAVERARATSDKLNTDTNIYNSQPDL